MACTLCGNANVCPLSPNASTRKVWVVGNLLAVQLGSGLLLVPIDMMLVQEEFVLERGEVLEMPATMPRMARRAIVPAGALDGKCRTPTVCNEFGCQGDC